MQDSNFSMTPRLAWEEPSSIFKSLFNCNNQDKIVKDQSEKIEVTSNSGNDTLF